MTVRRSLLLLFYFALLLTTPASLHAQSPLTDTDFLPVEEAFGYQLSTNADGTVTLSWDIAPDYYLYRERLKIEGVNGELDNVDYPAGKTITDEFFGDSEVYFNRADLEITPGSAEKLKLTWQGCAEAGLCYPPQHATVDLETNAAETPTTSTPPDSAGSSTSAAAVGDQAEDQSLATQLADSSLLLNLAIFFGLGLLLVFTPCVLPMVPILSAVIVGSNARRGKALWLSSVFVIAMAITYALLGVAAALAGANLQAVLQTPVFIAPLAVIFALLALAMFGLYELQLPAFIRDRLDRVNGRQQGGNGAGAAIMGFFAALLASPCMTAPLAGALLYIADTGDATLGGLALLALGLGMGAPLILLGTLGSSLLPKPGNWMNGVKAVFGFILLGTAIWFMERVIPDSATMALWGALTLSIGIVAWRLARTHWLSGAVHHLTGTLGLLVCLWGALMVVGAAAGGDRILQPLKPFSASTGHLSESPQLTNRIEFGAFKSLDDLDAALDTAAAKGQWTLVDFYADWCISCKVIEEEVFGDPRVREAMADMQLLRADVTVNDETDQALMRHFRVVGPPTIMIFGPDGEEYRAQRTVGEISADKFLKRLNQAQSS